MIQILRNVSSVRLGIIRIKRSVKIARPVLQANLSMAMIHIVVNMPRMDSILIFRMKRAVRMKHGFHPKL